MRCVMLYLYSLGLSELQKVPVNRRKIYTGIDVFTDSVEQLICSLFGEKKRAKLWMRSTELFHAGNIVLLLKKTANTIESDLFQTDSF